MHQPSFLYHHVIYDSTPKSVGVRAEARFPHFLFLKRHVRGLLRRYCIIIDIFLRFILIAFNFIPVIKHDYIFSAF
jgi:hypothetical protein